MTDRHGALTVTLDRDFRSDDVADLITAIRQLRGVAGVHPEVSDINTHIALDRVRRELTTKLHHVLEQP